MEFRFETDYNLQTLTAMAKGLRKTVRQKRSRRIRIFAGIVLALGLLAMVLTLVSGEPFGVRDVLSVLAAVTLVYIWLCEDRLNGRVAKRNVLPGTEHSLCIFGEEGYTVKTSVTESKFSYAQILAICETPRYFVLALSKNQAQAFDKESMTGGSLDEFRAFLTAKTEKQIAQIK